jgi:hypothetical protein
LSYVVSETGGHFFAKMDISIVRISQTDLLQFRGCFDPFYSVGVRENRKM